MRKAPVALGIVLSGALVIAQAQERGAKALFLDTQSGKMALPRIAAQPRSGTDAPRAGAAVQVPAVTGLMYYLELLQPDGQLMRVTSSTVFHSGEKVRLHVTSNVDGSLVILQKQDQGPFERLLPSPALPASYATAKKGVDTVLPSGDGWFKFDEHPGEIQLLVMLVAAPESGAAPVASADRQSVLPPSADALQSAERLQRGSKALVIETTNSPSDAGEWHVVDAQRDRKVTPGQIVVEIRLQHRPRA